MAGNRLLDSDGNRLLSSDGEVILVDGTGDPSECCDGSATCLCGHCSPGTVPTSITATFAGVDIMPDCFTVCGGGWASAKVVSGTINGTYTCLPVSPNCCDFYATIPIECHFYSDPNTDCTEPADFVTTTADVHVSITDTGTDTQMTVIVSSTGSGFFNGTVTGTGMDCTQDFGAIANSDGHQVCNASPSPGGTCTLTVHV